MMRILLLIYGTKHQGFGLTASGVDKSIQNQASTNVGWQMSAAGFRVHEPVPEDPVSPTGTALWEGFMIGMAEDMAAPDTNRRLYMNNTPPASSLISTRIWAP